MIRWLDDRERYTDPSKHFHQDVSTDKRTHKNGVGDKPHYLKRKY